MPDDAPALDVSPRPTVDVARGVELARELYGVAGPARELGSQQDRNVLLEPPGERRVVLKVANRGWGRAALEAQNAALLHLAERAPDLIAPVPLPAGDGALLHEVVDGEDTVTVRLLTFVEGTPLTGAGYLAPAVVADLGALGARLTTALAGLDHPGLDRPIQWDQRRAADVVARLAGSVRDPHRRAVVQEAARTAAARLDPLAPALRVGPVHGDLTDDNVVGDPDEAGRVRPTGVIDFGDLALGWLAGDLAVTCTSVLRRPAHHPLDVLPAVRAYDALLPLRDEELAALWPLVVLRGAVLVAAGEHQLALDPDNPDLAEPMEGEWHVLTSALSLDPDAAEAALRAALGRPPAPAYDAARAAAAAAAPLVPGTTPVVLDLSVTSEHLHGGRFLEPGVEEELLRAAAGSGAAVTRWGEARLTRTVLDTTLAPAAVALVVDLLLPQGTPLTAPVGGSLTADEDGVRLTHASGLVLHLGGDLTGVRPGGIEAGAPLARAGAGPVRVQWCVVPGRRPPGFATGREAPAWRTLCPDPSALLGTDVVAVDDDPGELLGRRRSALAPMQESYYDEPMRIERGWRHHLVDVDGRAYVDAVNNVASIGHGHPRLADAVERQLRTLNTNSRFHYRALVELSERLAALAPDPLDQVFLVNSGSEAVDLALRMAQTVTGRPDVVAVLEAYHGWTALSDAVSTSLYDNPAALGTRPDWVHLASAPNPYRGRHRGPGAGAAYGQEVRDLVEGLVADGRPPAAFVCEPLLGNAGGVLLPDGYLAAAYDAVRAAGGLAVADEVQVGYGRTGRWWWAFERSGVVPDVITVAKPMGAGHPLGAVITTRAVAEAFGAAGSFFSSAGGSPVSCVTGLTVLDVIEDEGLQANAAAVGDHLLAGLAGLADRHRIVGAVHGAGLYLGVELVRDRVTLEPATAECAAICERLRELGVVVQPAGERANVLKLKPPMTLTRGSADVVLGALDTVLRDGW
ncbi:aminotransferase [Lapillicoccus jejuensis]|uniref:Hydroxylysine kinase /5-phosphonooxy-L-lysine phospho-lyase n=1 Tax=Lapillicoccus jejuensis TaxID=402171 RepID=A0A542E6F5_9MICO|nr:aminotransferase [Lapillicoccus jejuensis]TQJ10911.1 hydroxylysine kinase /5-phosphonooxy-L-lysine phospho-lyase [Lapillicoccus jejuensis]